MKLYQVGLHCIACVACLMCSFVSLNLPWVKLNVEVKDTFFSLKVPFVLGLFSCFGSNCGKVPFFTHPDKVVRDDLDILSDLHLIDYESILKDAVSPFRMASNTTIVMISCSCIIISISLGMCFHQLYSGIYVDYERHAILFIAGLLFYYIAALAYVALTVRYLDGGEYIGGLWLCGNTGMFGLACSVVCLLLSKSRRPGYMPLREQDFVDIERAKSQLPSFHSHHSSSSSKGTDVEEHVLLNENRDSPLVHEEFVSVELVPTH